MSHLNTAYLLGTKQAAYDFAVQYKTAGPVMRFDPEVIRLSPQKQAPTSRVNFGANEGSTVRSPVSRVNFGANEGSTVRSPVSQMAFGPGEGSTVRGSQSTMAQRAPSLRRIQGMPQTGAGGLIPSTPLQTSGKNAPASMLGLAGKPGNVMPPDRSAALAQRIAPKQIATNPGDMLASLGL